MAMHCVRRCRNQPTSCLPFWVFYGLLSSAIPVVEGIWIFISLVANLSAANCYKVEHLKRPENWALGIATLSNTFLLLSFQLYFFLLAMRSFPAHLYRIPYLIS
ncbi:uncharacterized protein LOC111295559 [Durio zibethinus]|uniref:Uncharacterized protein LOC111295559 n=1 Tax=Durio zibethinus TaxID=66656 RepID=A0A6P5YX25_DURZI|nr:uncharacterized protein LOC111295559 [Durio zibethinus]